jgi:multicomponent Na+:H+ antiporter subunit F
MALDPAMFTGALFAVLTTMVLVLVRATRGPTVYDRILSVNMFGTCTVLLIAVAGFVEGRPDFLDLALVYALVSFIGVIAVTKYARFGNLASDDVPKGEGEA